MPPSTAIANPTPQLKPDATAVPVSIEPTHQPEPTGAPIAPTPEVRQTIAPAPTPTPIPPTQTPTVPLKIEGASLIIECIFFDGLVRTTEADEYVQVLNKGGATVNLLGWRLLDRADGTPEFTFPSFGLQPQASLRVYTNEEHPESGGFSFQRKSSIWNNSNPDEAALIDPDGQTVSFISYPPGC